MSKIADKVQGLAVTVGAVAMVLVATNNGPLAADLLHTTVKAGFTVLGMTPGLAGDVGPAIESGQHLVPGTKEQAKP